MIFYILVFKLFFPSLYIGVVVNTFEEVRTQHGQLDEMTEAQRKWVTMKATMSNSRALIAETQTHSKLAKLCFKMRNHIFF